MPIYAHSTLCSLWTSNGAEVARTEIDRDDVDRQPAGADQRVDVIGHRNAVNLDAVESVSVVVLVERFGTLSGARSARSVRLDVAAEKLAGVEGSSMAVRAPPACVPM